MTRLPNPYPTDSTYHRCCRSIGRHIPECPVSVRAAIAADLAAARRHLAQVAAAAELLATNPDAGLLDTADAVLAAQGALTALRLIGDEQ